MTLDELELVLHDKPNTILWNLLKVFSNLLKVVSLDPGKTAATTV